KGIGAYVARMHKEGGAEAWRDSPEPATRLAETWWLGLRLAEGLTPAEARERAGFAEEDDPALPIAERLRDEGLLEADDRGQRYRLTSRGLALADHVAKRFLQRAG